MWNGVDVSEDGLVVAFIASDGGCQVIWRGEYATRLRLPPQYDHRYTRLSPDGRWLATGSHFYDNSGSQWRAGTPPPAD